MASFVLARSILEKLTSRKPERDAYEASLAECYSAIGITQGQLEFGDSGLEILEKAKKSQQTLIGRSPTDQVYKKRMAEIINALGFVYYNRLDVANASRCFEEVQQICQSLLAEIGDGPKPVRLLDLMGIAQYNMAAIQEVNGQYAKGLELSEKTLSNRAALVAAHQSVMNYQENLGLSYSQVALGRQRAGQTETALSMLSTSIAILKKLVASEPGQARYHAELARSWNSQGVIRDGLHENEKAIADFENAVAELKAAIARSPHDNVQRAILCDYLENLGEQYVDLGRVQDGLPYYLEAKELRRQLHSSHPERDEFSAPWARRSWCWGPSIATRVTKPPPTTPWQKRAKLSSARQSERPMNPPDESGSLSRRLARQSRLQISSRQHPLWNCSTKRSWYGRSPWRTRPLPRACARDYPNHSGSEPGFSELSAGPSMPKKPI